MKSNQCLQVLQKPKKIRWHGRSYTAKHSFTLGKKKYYVVKKLSTKREQYMAFDTWTNSEGEMWGIIGIDGRNLSTKLQKPGLVEKLKRLSGNDGRLPTIYSYHQVKNGRVYLVTSWTEGDTLARYLEKVRSTAVSKQNNKKVQSFQPQPSAYSVCQLMRGLAHGLYQLHNLNIIHGDLNPNNLILQRNSNRIVMVDFGSAWLVEYTTTRAVGDGNIPRYTAPELLLQEAFVDARSDQFSLGILWYELLTLKIPYGSYGGKLVLPEYSSDYHKIVSSYKNPSTLSPDGEILSREAWILIDRIIKRCLQIDYNQRYPTDRALLDDVDELWRRLKPKKMSESNEILLKGIDWFNRLFNKG